MATPVKSNQQHVFLHDAICEGPVEGLLYGTSSVFLNNNRARDLSPDASYTPINGQITFTSTTDTSGSIVGSSMPSAYVGTPNNTNYIILRAGSITKSSTSALNLVSGSVTITGSSTFSSAYNTKDDPTKAIALVSTDASNTVYLVGEGEVNLLGGLDFTPAPSTGYTETWWHSPQIPYKIQLVESLEISSISSGAINTTSGPSLGSATYTFYISGSLQPEPEDVEADNPGTQNLQVQFRNGSTFQDPITELNGVGGGTSYTGNPQILNPQQLKQLDYSSWNAANPSDTFNYPGYSTSLYPDGESITTEGASQPTVISGADFTNGNQSVVPDLDEVRISIAYNSFYAINKDNGDETNNNAVYLFQIRKKDPGASTFGAWRNAFNDGGPTSTGQIFHSGKNKSAISFEHFIDLDFIRPFSDFEIRVTRLTRHKGRAIQAGGSNAGEKIEQGDATSYISNITAINKDKFSYPYTAHAGVFLDSREYASVPKRSYEMRGLKVRVPNGYTPREYTSNGIATYPSFWDGTLSDSLYYTNNPAWVFYDIVVNDRFGAGEWITENDVDLYALYRISKYCDELVPSGRKDGSNNDILEPRFTANLYLSKATDVYKVLKDMATIFTSLIYWMDGKMTTILDAPGDPVYNFSKANVIDGAFTYETTGQKTKTNQVVVTWNDPSLNYEQTTLIVEDRNSIVNTGRIIKEDAFAFGCTSEGQAQRYGKWKLFTSQGQTEIVTFKTSFEGAFVKPGDIIQVQDSSRFGAKFSGRIADVTNIGSPATNTKITLDRPVTLTSNASYELTVLITEPAAFYVGDGTVNIRNAGDTANEETYTRGQRITRAWVDANNNGTRTLETINTEVKASNAWTKQTGGEFLATTWKQDSYVESLPVNNSQTNVTELTANGVFGVLPKVNSIWMLTETENSVSTVGSAQLYKVLNISADDKNIYSISAVEHYNEKYAFVDDPNALFDLPDSIYPTEEDYAQAPTNIFVLQNSEASRPDEEIGIQWEYPAVVEIGGTSVEANRYLDSFEIFHNIPDLETPISVGKRARRYNFTGVPDGVYVFRVRAISVSGKKSEWVTARYVVDDPFTDNVNRNKGLQTEGLASSFPFVSNHSGVVGTIRGAYDTTGTITYSYKDIVTENGNYYYLSGIDANVGHVDIATDNANNEDTWTPYTGGIFKFTQDGSNVLIAPSKFRRSEVVSLSANYTLDCNVMNSLEDNFPGVLNANPRSALVVLDHSSSSLKLIKATFDDVLNIFYWQDLNVFDPDNDNAVWSSIGNVTVAAGSNKVVGSGFSNLNNLNKLKFSSAGTSISVSSISWSSNVATVTLSSNHSLEPGDVIDISGATPTAYNTTKAVVISTPSASTFTYSLPLSSSPGSYSSGATMTPYPFYEAARVAYVESNTVLYLNKVLDNDTSFAGVARVQQYAPDFRRDVILGEIFYNTSTGNYKFSNFLSLDPNLVGGRSAFLDSNVAFINFDIDNEQVLLPDDIILEAIATGYDNPRFKITYGTSDAEFEPEDTQFYSGDAGNPNKYLKTIYTPDGTGTNNLTYGTGSAYTFNLTVAEAADIDNTDKQRNDTFNIYKVDEVSVGSGAKTVQLELEDYSIVYDENGLNPVFNNTSGQSGSIRLNAVAGTGFTNPLFKFTIDGSAGSWNSSGSNTYFQDYTPPSDYSTWTGGKQIKIEVAEEPLNWSQGVNDPAQGDVEATDIATIIGVQLGKGGIAVVLSNPTHSLPSTTAGIVTSNAGSGTTIEVFSGGVALDYVSSNPSLGEWTFTSITDSDTNISPGAISGAGTTIATIADHTFGNSALDDTESVTYNIRIKGGGTSSDINTTVIQTFSLAKAGVNGAPGTSAGLVYLYAASEDQPSEPQSTFPDVTVSLTTGQITGYTEGTSGGSNGTDPSADWYTEPGLTTPTSTERVWVIAATANGTGSSDTISYSEWSDPPTQFSGIDGFNQATIELFQASSSNSSAPADPTQALTYTFETGVLSTTGINNWSRNRPSPSRSLPYVWRISAAAISNTATDSIPTADWSAGSIVDSFVEDGITLELDNDSESVGGTAGQGLSNLSIATTARVYRANTDITSEWNFTATLATGMTANTTGTGSSSSTFTVTALSSAYTSGNLVITATPKATGDYAGSASRSVNFTVTKINNGQNGVSYRISPSDGVVDYNPNATPNPTWNPTSVSFSAVKIEAGSSSSFTGYWKLNGVNQGQASSISSGTISSTSGNITAELYLDSGYNQLVDTETVPIVPRGSDGQSITGDRGARVITGYIYYQTAQSSAPTVPATTNLSVNWSTGVVTAPSGWGIAPPTFAAGSANTYWYYSYTMSESGAYNPSTNTYASTSKTTNPSAGSSAIQGIGFQNLVTFSSLTSSGTTQIDGSRITTGTIDAQRISLSSNNIVNFLGYTPYNSTNPSGYVNTSQAAAAAPVQTVNTTGGILSLIGGQISITESNIALGSLSGTLGVSQGGTGATSASAARTALDVYSQAETDGLIPNLTNYVEYSNTDIVAGRIALTTTGLIINKGTTTPSVAGTNRIILDTTGGNNAIKIYDSSSTVPRVILGKLT